MSIRLNDRAARLVDGMLQAADDLRIGVERVAGGLLLDCGVDHAGGLEAGRQLAELCTSGLATVSLGVGTLDGASWPEVVVATDHPVEACLLSQYAGWQISVENFFAMGSGPMRAAAAREELFDALNYRERPARVVGVLETGQWPPAHVYEFIAERAGVTPADVTLAVAPTSSLCGTLQVVSRSVETALHKLHELGFDVKQIVSGQGAAPLPPVAAGDLEGIGRTNDAILYGGRVTLWVRGDDEALAEVVGQVPAAASPSYGRPFLEVFEAAGRDFYQIDPLLFSPGEITLFNLATGRVHRAGRTNPDVLRQSFGF